MNVSLTPDLEKFVTEKVESGKYGSAEEVVREGLRLLKEHEENGQHPRTEERRQSSVRIVAPVTKEKEWQWLHEHRRVRGDRRDSVPYLCDLRVLCGEIFYFW